MIKPKSGFYWLCHHRILVEWVWDEDERRESINSTKPKSEIAVRQQCFQLVKGKLPDEIIAAYKVRNEAADVSLAAFKAYNAVHDAWLKALNKCEDIVYHHKTDLEAQHAQEYPECAEFWNGEEIVFPKGVRQWPE